MEQDDPLFRLSDGYQYFWVLVVTLSVVLFGAFKFFVPYF